MDYDKLIERLSRYSEPVIAYKLDDDFAAAVTEAAAELRGKCAGCSVPATTAEMIRDLNDAPKLRAENKQLRVDLARVTAERDSAVSDIETVLAYGVENCELCANSQCHLRGGTKPCLPKWRGIKED